MKKKLSFSFVFFVSLVIHLLVLTVVFIPSKNEPEIKYTELKIKLGVKNHKGAAVQSQNYQAPLNPSPALKPQLSQQVESKESASSALLAKENEKPVNPLQKELANLPAEDNKNIEKKEVERKFEPASKDIVIPPSIPQPYYQQEMSAVNESKQIGSEIGNTESGGVAASYEQALPLWLDKFREYPEEARKKGIVGVGEVLVKIDRNGHVLLGRVIKSTGHQILDDALERMIQDANPVLAVPDDYLKDKKVFSYRIRFEFSL